MVQNNARAPSSEDKSIHYKKQEFRSQTIIKSLKSVMQNIQYIHNLHNYRTDLAWLFKEMKDR